MINKNFLQKTLVLMACSFGLIANAGYTSNLDQDVDPVNKSLPVNPVQQNGNTTTVDVNAQGYEVTTASVNTNNDQNKTEVKGSARNIPLLDVSTDPKNPV